MIPITFFVFSSRDGASVSANAADFTPMDPSIARAIAIRASATLYFSTRFDRTAFARSKTRKNSTINASCLSFRSLWPRSATRRVRELEHLAIAVRERLFPDDGDEAADVLAFRIRGVELVRDLLVVLPGPVLADSGVHQPGKGGQRVDRRVDRLPVQVPGDRHLAFRDVPREVRDRMRPVVVRDRHDGNLRDAPFSPVDAAGSLVHRGEIRVHVAGISATARNLLPRSADLSQRLGIV